MSYLPTMPFNNALVRRFLNWRQGDEEESWRNRAVDALVKKLRKNDPEGYKILELVLLKKSNDTPCIALSRSQDGRLQVSHKKMLPHVMYCRIFRWPDLQSQHELKSIQGCQYPASKRDPKICVNPYHYTRVEHSLYPPVVTPRGDTDFANASPPSTSPLSPISTYSHHSQSPNYFQQSANMQAYSPPQVSQSNQDQLYYQSQATNFNYQGQPLLQDASYYGNVGESQSPPPSYSSRNAVVPMDDQGSSTSNGMPNIHEDAWCKIQYSELTKNVGEPFKSSSPQVYVDGFTNPSTHDQSRFSLGVLSNVNRNSTIEMTRRAIRRGILLENIEGQIFVKNLSESSIFFHSKNCNIENQLNQHAVVKIEPQKRQKIFEPKVFEGLVLEAISSGDGDSYERLYQLNEHCLIKMSFVKGWGSIYQRQDVTSTPCWIEICLLKPCEFIDRHLHQVEPPRTNITSTS